MSRQGALPDAPMSVKRLFVVQATPDIARQTSDRDTAPANCTETSTKYQSAVSDRNSISQKLLVSESRDPQSSKSLDWSKSRVASI